MLEFLSGQKCSKNSSQRVKHTKIVSFSSFNIKGTVNTHTKKAKLNYFYEMDHLMNQDSQTPGPFLIYI